jgi:hypothetical protein
MGFNEYNQGFNDGLYHAADFLKSVAKDLNSLGMESGTEDAELLEELADVILEDVREETID